MKWVFSTIFTLFFFFLTPSFASASTFYLSPTSTTVKVGDVFAVDVGLNTNSTPSTSAEVVLSFDPNVVDIVETKNGNFYDFHFQRVEKDKVYLVGGMRVGSRVGSGLLGKILLRGQRFGVSSLVFHCRARTKADFTNIVQENDLDTVECAELQNGVYTVEGSLDSLGVIEEIADQHSASEIPLARGILARPKKSPSPTLLPLYLSPNKSVLGIMTTSLSYVLERLFVAIIFLGLSAFGIYCIVVYKRS